MKIENKKVVAVFSNVTTGKFLKHVKFVDKYTELNHMHEQDQSRYNPYVDCALKSFKKWHPEIECVYINDDNLEEYLKLFGNPKLINSAVAQKFVIAAHVMEYYKADKLIVLDIDTITCSRFDEMLSDYEHDILASLNYNIQDKTEYFETPFYELEFEDGTKIKDSANLNSGVICFNNINALKRCVELMLIHPNNFGEQGAFNELVWVEGTFKTRVLDAPYITSDVVYNVRSKGVNFTNIIFDLAINQPDRAPINHYYVKDKKLFTHDHKHIKVWHIAEGLHGRPLNDFNRLTELYKTKIFNKETIKFLREECDCSDFFPPK
jgi:hypothetical protein